jgi:uncharacterized protein
VKAVSITLTPSLSLRGRKSLFLPLAIFATLLLGLARAEVPVPPLTARVTDLTATLNAQQQAALEQKLAAFEAKKGSQIAVLIVPTTQPETVEQYSIRVAEQWKLGRRGVDDGVLLLVAMKDRAVRIEVGYGLEGALPDATAKRIVEEYIVPRFKQSDFNGGIVAGTDYIIKVIQGEALPPPQARRPASPVSGFENLLVIGFFLVFVIGGILRAALGRVTGSGVIGAIAGVIAWVVIGSLIAAALIGVLLFVLSLFGGMASARGRGRIGGWPTGGGWSSGGGFSGGGGGFGGGGASGRW